MIIIESPAPGVLTFETPESAKTVRINPGNQSIIATSGGGLVRVLNDVGGPVTFSPIELGTDVIINSAATELSVPENVGWIYFSQFGEKITI